MPKSLIKLILFSTALTGCAYLADGSIQSVEVRTPGANHARCDVYVGGTKFIYMPPETRTVPKSEDNMIVDCHAPGNRHKKIVIEPVISAATAYNVSNAVVPGFAWDYASKSIYNFPPVVEVDFTHIRPQPSPLPAQNQPDIKQPEEYDLEEFSPGEPRLNSDRYAPDIQIQKRQVPTDFDLNAFGYQAEENRAVLGTTSSGVQVPAPPDPSQTAAPPSSSAPSPSAAPSETESGNTGDSGGGEPPAMSVPNLLDGEAEN